jgi:hypothetical protein
MQKIWQDCTRPRCSARKMNEKGLLGVSALIHDSGVQTVKDWVQMFNWAFEQWDYVCIRIQMPQIGMYITI